MDLDEDLERGMEKSDREKEEGAAPEIKVKDQAQPVPIELPPRRKVGDAVIAHYGEATIIAIHPNGNVDVKMDSGDVLLNVLSYCVWTEAGNSEGLASFDTFKKATRRGKPREEGKRKQDHTDLNKKQRIVLEGKMNTFFEGENESRLRRYARGIIAFSGLFSCTGRKSVWPNRLGSKLHLLQPAVLGD